MRTNKGTSPSVCTQDFLAADLQEGFGIETHGRHGKDHVLGVRKGELVRHRQGFQLKNVWKTVYKSGR